MSFFSWRGLDIAVVDGETSQYKLRLPTLSLRFSFHF